MLPTLFTIGSFQLKTVSLLQLVALLAAAFIFWKRGREEHYPEAQLFDGFVLSALFGWLVARLVFVIFNWQNLEFSLFNWLDIWSKPGMILEAGLIAAGIYLFRFAQNKKWDPFEILDFWALAVCLGMIFLNLGYFLAGTNFGLKTNLPWGVIFPSVFERHHPTQVYTAVFYLGLYIYLYWAEYKYRTFEWYRAGKKTAETGFLFSNLLIFGSFFEVLVGLIKPASLLVLGFSLDLGLDLALLVLGLILLLKRSHRVLFSFKQKQFLAIKK